MATKIERVFALEAEKGAGVRLRMRYGVKCARNKNQEIYKPSYLGGAGREFKSIERVQDAKKAPTGRKCRESVKMGNLCAIVQNADE